MHAYLLFTYLTLTIISDRWSLLLKHYIIYFVWLTKNLETSRQLRGVAFGKGILRSLMMTLLSVSWSKSMKSNVIAFLYLSKLVRITLTPFYSTHVILNYLNCDTAIRWYWNTKTVNESFFFYFIFKYI